MLGILKIEKKAGKPERRENTELPESADDRRVCFRTGFDPESGIWTSEHAEPAALSEKLGTAVEALGKRSFFFPNCG